MKKAEEGLASVRRGRLVEMTCIQELWLYKTVTLYALCLADAEMPHIRSTECFRLRWRRYNESLTHLDSSEGGRGAGEEVAREIAREVGRDKWSRETWRDGLHRYCT